MGRVKSGSWAADTTWLRGQFAGQPSRSRTRTEKWTWTVVNGPDGPSDATTTLGHAFSDNCGGQ